MNRRSFIKHVGHSVAIPGIIGSLGFSNQVSAHMARLLSYAQENDRVLVLIYLRGGNDGLNTLVPLDQLSALNAVRPHVVLPEKKLLPLKRTETALHPELSGFQSLYHEGKMQIIQSVGYPEPNLSHFRSTDIWMSGSDSNKFVHSGWTGRYLQNEFPAYPEGFPNEANPHPLAIEIGARSSLLFQGPRTPMSMVIRDPASFYNLLDDVGDEAPDTVAGDKLGYIRTVARQSQVYGQVVKEAADKVTQHVDYTPNTLSDQLKIVTKLIAGGLQTSLYLINYGGFDTHSKQVEESDHTTGWHAGELKDLNDGVVDFMRDLEFHGLEERVVGMTFSEFGRRIVSNASFGTDHGTAAPMFIFGNKVAGGQIIGKNPVIPANATVEDNLEMEFDYRQVYGSVLEQWLGASSESVKSVLFDEFSTLPVIGEGVVSSVGRGVESAESLSVYPNPLNGAASIEFNSYGERVEVDLIDLNGRPIQRIFSGHLPSGRQLIKWNTHHLSTGRYVVVVKGAQINRSQMVIKAD